MPGESIWQDWCFQFDSKRLRRLTWLFSWFELWGISDFLCTSTKFSSILRTYVDHKSGTTKFSKSQIFKYHCSFLQYIREHRHIETLCWWNQLGKFRYSHRGCYYRDSVEKKNNALIKKGRQTYFWFIYSYLPYYNKNLQGSMTCYVKL